MTQHWLWRSPQWIIPLAFLPAGLGLLYRAVSLAVLPEQLLALCLALFCLELARMAIVDLEDIASVMTAKKLAANTAKDKFSLTSSLGTSLEWSLREFGHLRKVKQSSAQDSFHTDDWQRAHLGHFFRIVVSTIVLEIGGFYLAWLSLPLGAAVIITSQLWFNLLAGVQLQPGKEPAIVPLGITERRAVILANVMGLGLLSLWFIAGVRIWLAVGLGTLVILFLGIKYIFLPLRSIFSSTAD